MIEQVRLPTQLGGNDCALAPGRDIYVENILNLNINKSSIKILGPSAGTEEKGGRTHYPAFLNHLQHQTRGRVEMASQMNTEWPLSFYKRAATI